MIFKKLLSMAIAVMLSSSMLISSVSAENTTTGTAYVSGYSATAKNSIKRANLPKPSNIKVKANWSDAVKISWDKVKGANGYRIYMYDDSDKSWVKLANVKGTTAMIYDDKTNTVALSEAKTNKWYNVGLDGTEIPEIKEDTDYKFKVVALDKKMNEGMLSGVINVHTKERYRMNDIILGLKHIAKELDPQKFGYARELAPSWADSLIGIDTWKTIDSHEYVYRLNYKTYKDAYNDIINYAYENNVGNLGGYNIEKDGYIYNGYKVKVGRIKMHDSLNGFDIVFESFSNGLLDVINPDSPRFE